MTMEPLHLTVTKDTVTLTRDDNVVEVNPKEAANLLRHLFRILPLTTQAQLTALMATTVATRLGQ